MNLLFCSCTAGFMSNLVKNTEDRFSHDDAHLVCGTGLVFTPDLQDINWAMWKFSTN